jgi:hypothetical protein
MAIPNKRAIANWYYDAMSENNKKYATNPTHRRNKSIAINHAFHIKMAHLMETKLIHRGVNSLAELDEDDVNSFMDIGDDHSLIDSDEGDGLVPANPSLGNFRAHAGKGMSRRPPERRTPPPSPIPVKLAKPAAAAASEPATSASKPKAKNPRVTKDDYVTFTMFLFDRIIPRFKTDESLINVTTEEFTAIVAKLKRNLALVPTPSKSSKSPRVTAVSAIKEHEFVPRPYTRRLFVEHISRAFEAEKPTFNPACRACSETITGMYAVSLRCPKTLMHPKCAAVILDAVSAMAYHTCLTPLYTCNANGTPRETTISCKHVDLNTSFVNDIYPRAIAMALSEERSMSAADARSEQRRALLEA